VMSQQWFQAIERRPGRVREIGRALRSFGRLKW